MVWLAAGAPTMGRFRAAPSQPELVGSSGTLTS